MNSDFIYNGKNLSVDKMYVIKTMTTEEIEEMHHLLKQVSRTFQIIKCYTSSQWSYLVDFAPTNLELEIAMCMRL